MFEQSILPKGGGRRGWIVAGVMVAQLAAVGVLILLPLIFLQVLPVPELTTMLVAPPPPPPPPPPAAPAVHAAAHIPHPVLRPFDAHALIAPRTIPKQIATLPEEDLPQAAPAGGVVGGVPGGVAGGQVGGVVGGILGAVPTIAPPPPPPPPKAVAQAPKPPAGPIRVGGAVEEARLIISPKPEYPRLAAEARIEGVVKLDAIIGKDGHVKDLKAVSGSPLLMPAALHAVAQWVYRPTYLNGKAVDIATEVDVQFHLT